MRWPSRGQTGQRARGHAFPDNNRWVCRDTRGHQRRANRRCFWGLVHIADLGMPVAVRSAHPADAPITLGVGAGRSGAMGLAGLTRSAGWGAHCPSPLPLGVSAETISYPQQDFYHASGVPAATLQGRVDLNPGLSCSRELSSACLAAWHLWPGPRGSAHSTGTGAAWPQLGTAGVSRLYPADIFCLQLCSCTKITENSHLPRPSSAPSLAPGPSEDLDDGLKILWAEEVLLTEAKDVP